MDRPPSRRTPSARDLLPARSGASRVALLYRVCTGGTNLTLAASHIVSNGALWARELPDADALIVRRKASCTVANDHREGLSERRNIRTRSGHGRQELLSPVHGDQQLLRSAGTMSTARERSGAKKGRASLRRIGSEKIRRPGGSAHNTRPLRAKGAVFSSSTQHGGRCCHPRRSCRCRRGMSYRSSIDFFVWSHHLLIS